MNRDLDDRLARRGAMLLCAASLVLVVPGRAEPPAAGPTRLVAIGGGERPAAAMARFVDWAGGPDAPILVVTWASGEPAESFVALRDELTAVGARKVRQAPMPPFDTASRPSVLASIREAAGIFFSGGDQARIMDVCGDAEILAAIRSRHAAGVVIGGTSAGTAAMSTPMITGGGDLTVIDASQVEVREGLSLLPGAVLDQHFVRRQRQNRLFGVVLDHPELLGLGVDEDTALAVSAGRWAEVLGRGVVLAVAARGTDSLSVDVLRPGQAYDLAKRERIRSLESAPPAQVPVRPSPRQDGTP